MGGDHDVGPGRGPVRSLVPFTLKHVFLRSTLPAPPSHSWTRTCLTAAQTLSSTKPRRRVRDIGKESEGPMESVFVQRARRRVGGGGQAGTSPRRDGAEHSGVKAGNAGHARGRGRPGLEAGAQGSDARACSARNLGAMGSPSPHSLVPGHQLRFPTKPQISFQARWGLG